MNRVVRLRRVAQAEYDADVDFYEVRQTGLGNRLLAAIRRALTDLAADPERWSEVEPGVREAPVPKWPYCIYYETHPDHVMVLAVFHTSRDPAVWQSRVRP